MSGNSGQHDERSDRRIVTKYDKGCRKTLGHGEFCVEGHLCGGCKDRQARARLPKIVTFPFNKGDEIESAQQMIRGLLHFGLIEEQREKAEKAAGGILLPELPNYRVIVPFTIGWEEKDGVSEVRQDTPTETGHSSDGED